MRGTLNRLLVLAFLLPVALGLGAVEAAANSDVPTSLRTVEGVVIAIETLTASSRVEPGMTAVRLRVDDPEPEEIDVLLAPEAALRQTGFEIEPGDRVRASIFLSGADRAEAHKVLNVSRNTMVRLRTLRGVPLWDRAGQWQGGPSRPAGHRHRRSG